MRKIGPSVLFRSAIAISLALFTSAIIAQAAEAPLERLLFGSCAKQDQPQPIWDAIVEAKPQRFVLLGDNIYGDSEDMDVLREKYALLGAQPGYMKLKRICPILATWDDHDYGKNDAGAEYKMRRESQQVFLDFFNVGPDDERRKRDGVYSSTIIGPPGKRVQIVLLDARFFRSPLKKTTHKAEPGEGFRGVYSENTDADATMLGEEQWKWLEVELAKPAELRLLGSGVQFVANENGWETWGNFPKERELLLKLLRDKKVNGVVILSGDRHLAELSCLPASHAEGIGYPLYDVTSSSLNSPNKNMTKAGVRFANELNAYRVGLTYFDVNHGAVLVDWNEPDPVVRLQVRDLKGGVVLQQRFPLSKLRAN